MEFIDVEEGVYLNKIHLETLDPSVYGKSLFVRHGVVADPLWMINGLLAPTVEKNMEFIVIDEVPILRIVTSDVSSVLTGMFPKLI